MHHIIYLSQATAPFGDAQLQALLARARVSNAQYGITGLLLYGNDQFLQVLEGERAAVHARYDRIQQDPRHRDITTFADKAIRMRTFSNWDMAFTTLPQQPFLELTNYTSAGKLRLEDGHSIQADFHIMHLVDVLRTFIMMPSPII